MKKEITNNQGQKEYEAALSLEVSVSFISALLVMAFIAGLLYKASQI